MHQAVPLNTPGMPLTNIAAMEAIDVIKKIRILREQKRYTQAYMAAKLGISQNAYSKVEVGGSTLSVERLLQIATVLNVSVSKLVTERKPTDEQAPL